MAAPFGMGHVFYRGEGTCMWFAPSHSLIMSNANHNERMRGHARAATAVSLRTKEGGP